MAVEYVQGDATRPLGAGNKVIVHVCNDVGGWGRGFVLAVSNRWTQPEAQYRAWAKSGENFTLGAVQFIPVETGLWVANLIGQRDVTKGKDGLPPVRYEAIGKGLAAVAAFAKENNASVHMPRIGCGLAGGTWTEIEPLITDTLLRSDVAVVVYDFA